MHKVSIPEELRHIDYYTSPEILKSYTTKLFLPPPSRLLDTTKDPYVNTVVFGSLFARSLLARVTLPNTRDNESVYAKLFLKVDHPALDVVPGCLSKNSFPTPPTPKELRTRAEYQRDTLNYWSRIGLPSPKGIHFSEHTVPIQKSRGRMSQGQAYALVMEDVPSPSHDKDILALQQRIRLYQGAMEDRLLDRRCMDTLRSGKKQLKEELSRVIKSMMNTQARCQLLGTYHLNDIARRMKYSAKQPADYVTEAHKSVSHYLRAHTVYRLALEEEDFLKRAQQNKLTVTQWREQRARATEFRKVFDPIFEALYCSNPEQVAYIHGDGYPHNYAGRSMREGQILFAGQDLGIQSVMFSPHRAKMGLPEEDLTKLLTSPILGLNSKDVELAVVHYHKHLEQTTQHLERRGRNPLEGMVHLMPEMSLAERLDRFDLMFLKVFIEGVGLKGKDETFNKQFYDATLAEPKPYAADSTLVRFPKPHEDFAERIPQHPKTVDYLPYKSDETLDHLSKLARGRMETFLERSGERNKSSPFKSLEDNVRKLGSLFRRHKLLRKELPLED